ncbi:uncharacterized protein N7496_001451 [Penicillium cataractarum]|uniref:Xylanolytic transcriptional activator regulatory domain-containing protein n=1 Tax=Penicillium cataractarum TaxID=2100454 RepID=A0A9W9VW24_9EURO|nr:uncharacterized protein N7496_001451 [Penicillium cataractarum]KAJ5390383.1 hypothetical protein N7496_001451 [Penicillium cataractarum]
MPMLTTSNPGSMLTSEPRWPFDVQNLFQRIQELEGALSRVGTTPESSGQALDNTEELATPVRSTIDTTHASTVASCREGLTFSGSSLSPITFAQTPTSSYSHITTERSAQVDRSARQWGPNWYFNGIPISSEAGREWVSKRTGQPVSWADFSIPIVQTSEASTLAQSLSPALCELPDKEATREVMTAFLKSSFRLAFPVLDEVLFQTTLEIAYEHVDGISYSPMQISAKACILSMLAIAPRIDMSRQLSVPIDTDLCAAKAHCLLLRVAEDTSLPTLQTAIMLRTFCTDWQGATFFQSIACRIVCALKGHMGQSPSSPGLEITRPEREISHIRTLFWLCYMLDKDISLFTGNPPLLSEVYCDLTLHDNYYDHYTYLPSLNTSLTGDEKSQRNISPYLPGDPHLSHLKEKVYRQLLSARALKDNDNQLLLNIRQLDDEIEQWRLSIPVNFRPALFVSKNTMPNASDEGIPFIIRRMSLQLDYHHLMTVIHTTVRKCTVETSDETPDLHSVFRFVSGSWSFNAMVFEDACRFDCGRCVSSRIDLELLISAANTIRNMPVRALTKTEVSHIRELSKFVMRLVWLGTCAVTKAEKEND